VFQGGDNTRYQGNVVIVEGKSTFKQLMDIHDVDPPLWIIAQHSCVCVDRECNNIRSHPTRYATSRGDVKKGEECVQKRMERQMLGI
jgi:hypothetical protein